MSKSLVMRFVPLFVSVIILTVGDFSLLARDVPPVFSAGAATSNIAPPLGELIVGGWTPFPATNIHDELHARCLVLDDGKVKLAFVLCDNVGIPVEVFDLAKQQVLEATGLPTSHLLMAATHTHSATTARGRCKVIRETELTNPFGGLDQVRMNPPSGSAALDRPAGPTDSQISFVSVQRLDGRPIALLANYSLHDVGGVRSRDVSADYFGYFAKFIAQKLGATEQSPPFVGILSNGTSGDVNNINFSEVSTRKYKSYEKMQEVAEKVASRVYEAHQTLEFHDWVALGAAETRLALKVRQPTSEMLQHFAEITSIRIGDLGIAAIPFETFTETGLEIKERGPFGQTFTIELANGSYGYLPTPEQHRLGGYETWLGSKYVEHEATTKIVAALLDLFQTLKQNGE